MGFVVALFTVVIFVGRRSRGSVAAKRGEGIKALSRHGEFLTSQSSLVLYFMTYCAGGSWTTNLNDEDYIRRLRALFALVVACVVCVFCLWVHLSHLLPQNIGDRRSDDGHVIEKYVLIS